MKGIFKQSNLIPLLLVVYIGKNFIIPAPLFDFGLISVLTIALLFKLRLDKEELNQEAKLFEKIDALEHQIAENKGVLEHKISETKKEYDTEAKLLKDKISGVSLMYQKQVNPTEKIQRGSVW